jgi:hypothetical protein
VKIEHPIKLIAIDLDGTLLDSAKRVCPKAAESLIGVRRRGVKVVIASARPPRSVRPFYQCLELDTWQINYNGALIWDEPGRRAVRHTPMQGARVLELALAARSRFPQVLITCEILDRWYTDREDQTYTTQTGRLFKPDVIAPLEEFCNQPITKFMLLGSVEVMRALKPMVDADPAVAAFHSDADLIEVVHCRVNKGVALAELSTHYGISMENVMAIGDAANDIPMLQAAGVGVAMDNARAEVKAAADWVAPSNEDHGVHAALERFGMI